MAAGLTKSEAEIEADRLSQRPTDRALWALGRPVVDCTANRPCKACLDDGRKPIPYGQAISYD